MMLRVQISEIGTKLDLSTGKSVGAITCALENGQIFYATVETQVADALLNMAVGPQQDQQASPLPPQQETYTSEQVQQMFRELMESQGAHSMGAAAAPPPAPTPPPVPRPRGRVRPKVEVDEMGNPVLPKAPPPDASGDEDGVQQA